jgi:hypothetical protein
MNQLTENEIKELIEFKNLIIKLINDIPNDMELGEKIRRKIIKEEK